MLFAQFQDDVSLTWTYILADERSKEALIIDSVKEHVDVYETYLHENQLRLVYSLETHVHADHVTGAGLLRMKTGCHIGVSRHANLDAYDTLVGDGDQIKFGSHQLNVIETSGHTSCSLCFYGEGRVFTGDTLFINGCGRTDFQGGSSQELWQSVTQKLWTLPEDTCVYPGHDYHGQKVSTIKQEKETNVRFKDQTKESFCDLMDHLNLPKPKLIDIAVPANMCAGL